MRQAFAGLLWSKQFYHYDVRRVARSAIPAQPPPPEERQSGRNHDWRHLNNADVISMPDKWEYPWYAAWDLAFHCIPLALVDARVRQGAARAAAARMVHAPERTAPGLRVELRRREPAGARVGGAARVPHRPAADRPRRPPLPRARLPQAAAQLHVVGEPQGRRGEQHLRGRLPRARQHRRVRSQQAAAGRRRASNSPTARAGWRCTRSTCSPSPWSWRPKTRSTRTSPASSSSTSSTSRTR